MAEIHDYQIERYDFLFQRFDVTRIDSKGERHQSTMSIATIRQRLDDASLIPEKLIGKTLRHTFTEIYESWDLVEAPGEYAMKTDTTDAW